MLHAFLILAFVGFIVFLIVNYIPMPPIFKTIIIALAALFCILFVAQILGLSTGVHLAE